jgi:HSP20 family molecular chaperone IbpA
MSTAFSLAPLFRSSVGFDRFNDLFETALRNEPGSTYPPYNVEKHGDDQYRIVVAAAGFQEEDLDLQVEKSPSCTKASPSARSNCRSAWRTTSKSRLPTCVTVC